ncbi:MAG: hypothetical protein QXI16_04175 [Sulfolobaceae archaeon]
MDIITDIISAVGEWITGVFGWLGSAITGVVSVFYDSTTGLTLVGRLLLFQLATVLVFFAFKFIMSLISK